MKKLKIIIFIVLIIVAFVASRAHSQVKEYDPYTEGFPKIMVIPYHPANYESDVNLSGKIFKRKPRGFINVDANQHFRDKLDKALFESLLTYFDINRIYYYETEKAKQDLEKIYQSIEYQTHSQRIKAYFKNYKNFNIFQIVGMGKSRWGVDCVRESRGRPLKKYKKIEFTDVQIKDSTLIPYLNEKYQCEYYLFVNHVELRTRFKVCKDLMKNVHQKDIVLHFTVVNNDGDKMTGGLVAVTYSPKRGRNDILEIVENNMTVITELVTEVIREDLDLGLQYFPE